MHKKVEGMGKIGKDNINANNYHIEGLSLMIADAKQNGLIKGIKISNDLIITHLLFVDDVILFGMGTVADWIAFKVILDTFCAASGMNINMDKSCFCTIM